MRLWHQKLIPYLPRQQLLGQHRECCALRGKGWKKPHATINYVFNYPPHYLIAYHYLIIQEMKNRGYNPDPIWRNSAYRGKVLEYDYNWTNDDKACHFYFLARDEGHILYEEHNEKYLQECLENLKNKGIEILNCNS